MLLNKVYSPQSISVPTLETVPMKIKLKRQHQYLSQNINLWRIRPHLNCGFCISFYFFDKDTLDSIQFLAHVCWFSSPWVVMVVATKVGIYDHCSPESCSKHYEIPQTIGFPFAPIIFWILPSIFFMLVWKPLLLFFSPMLPIQAPGKLLQSQGTQPAVEWGWEKIRPWREPENQPNF